MKKILKWTALLVLLLLIIGAVYVYEKTERGSTSYDYQKMTPTAVLLQSNVDFATANSYQQSGNYAPAKQFYQQALLSAQDSTQAAQIQFYIASTDQQSGDFVDSITLFKQIAASNPNWPIMEAYAVQALAQMHYQNRSDQTITTDIFSTEPYSSLYPATSTADTAYHALFTYAASIFPLGISEARIANWDAQDLQTLLGGATTTPSGIAKIAQIHVAIAAAEADIARIESDPVASNDIPTIATYEGVALGYLATVGAEDPRIAEAKFQQAIQYMALINVVPGQTAEFYYAAFLLDMYGQSRLADIDKLLSVFSSSNENNISPSVPALFIDARTDPAERVNRARVVSLGQADPSFRTYLISLGWQAGDFAKN